MGKKLYYERPIVVYCYTCREWYYEKKVEFINIEEGIQGEDILTFKCPVCSTVNSSKFVRQSIPL